LQSSVNIGILLSCWCAIGVRASRGRIGHMFANRRRISVVRIGEIRADGTFRALARGTRMQARNVTCFPTNKPTNISTNISTNKPTFFNNVYEGAVFWRQRLAEQRDTRGAIVRVQEQLWKNVGIENACDGRGGPKCPPATSRWLMPALRLVREVFPSTSWRIDAFRCNVNGARSAHFA
jgi:hypothetical protein